MFPASNVLAKILSEASKLYESSYDHEASNAADKAAVGKKIVVSYKSFYRMSLEDACIKAAADINEPELGRPAYLLLKYNWNDSQDWAFDMVTNPCSTDTIARSYPNLKRAIDYLLSVNPGMDRMDADRQMWRVANAITFSKMEEACEVAYDTIETAPADGIDAVCAAEFIINTDKVGVLYPTAILERYAFIIRWIKQTVNVNPNEGTCLHL